jgi:hypothetical protein
LKSLPRMNVALTRCRKGMVVITNKCFLQEAGVSTLLGKLCRAWSQHRDAWIDWKAVLSNSVALPGLPVPTPSSNVINRVVPTCVLAPTSNPATTSQRPTVDATNTKIDEGSYPGQGWGTHTKTPRCDPPPTPTRTDERFLSTSSAARTGTTGTCASDGMRHRLERRLASASQIPKYDPISKLRLRQQTTTQQGYHAVPNWRQKQQ